jgi:hypothetical protein
MKLPGLWLICVALVASGCASPPETRHARPALTNEPVVLQQGEILVFGRLLFTENGKSKVPYGLGKPLWQLETPKAASDSAPPTAKRTILPFLGTDKDGFFAYVIPAGHYEIAHVEPLGYTPLLRPGLEFDTRKPGRAYYLGDVEVDYDAWSWLYGLWGNHISRITRVEVVDRFDTARGTLAQRLALDPEGIDKALLTGSPGKAPQLFEPFVPPIIHR